MADDTIVDGLLAAERGGVAGESLVAQIIELTNAMNEARREAAARGDSDTAIIGAMRKAWEAFPWEVRFARLASSYAQWFTITASHNFDRVPMLARIPVGPHVAEMAAVDLVLALPELERAFNHNAGEEAELNEDGIAEPCSCFAELVRRIKPESFVALGGDTLGSPETNMFHLVGKGEA